MIGQVLNGTYQLIDLIGSGGYANVYRARDLRSDAIVAVKVLHAHFAREPDIAARFEREVGLARRLQTPYVARILDAGRDPGSPPYMVMELVQGRTVAQIVEQRGQLPISEATGIVDQLLTALKQAHALGIIHRDLKPHNLMLDTAGRVRVLDFGLSRVVGAGTITADGQLLGTPEYMAPEQLAGQPIDARADLYAVGAVLYHLLAGRPPYLRTSETDLWELVRRARREPPQPIQQLRPDTPHALVEVIARAMARDPEQRYADAFEMQHALAVATGEDPPTPQSLRAPDLTRPLQADQPPAAAPSPNSVAAPASTVAPPPASAPELPPTRPRVADQQTTVVVPILSAQPQAQPGPDLAPPSLSRDPAAPLPVPPPASPQPGPTRLMPQQPARPVAGADQTRIMESGELPPAYGRAPAREDAPPPPALPHAGRPASVGAAHPGPPQGPPHADLSRAPTVPPRRWRMPAWQLAGIAVVALLLVGFGVAIGRFASLPLRANSPTPTAIAEATAIPTATAVVAAPAAKPATPAAKPAAAAPKPTLAAPKPTAAAPKPAATIAPPASGSAPAPTSAAAAPSPTVVAVAPPPVAPPTTVPPTVVSPPAVANAIPRPSDKPGAVSPVATLAPDRPSPAGTPSASDIILSDTFDRSEGGLLTRTSPRPNDYTFAYDRGEYVIKKVNPTLPAAPIVFMRGEYADTVIAVDVRLVGEAGARYAFVVCRDKSEGGQTRQYRASIVPEGRRVILSYWADGGQKVLAETRDNPAIQIGNATNRLELRCAGSKIETIVNGKTVVSVEDGTLASGEHGLGAGTFSGVEGSLEARFDNLEVRRP